MKRHVLAVTFVLVAVLLVALPHAGHAGPQKKFRVSFYGAVVGPGKINGDPWDAGCDKVTQQILDELARTMRVIPTSALGPNALWAKVAPLIAKWASKPVCKPDPKGSVELLGSGSTNTTRALEKIQDTFTPQWDVSWSGVA